MNYKKNIVTGSTIFAIVIFLEISTYYISLGPCPSGSHPCDNDSVCISPKYLCNGYRDCKDGSDEDRIKMCGNFHGEGETIEQAYNESKKKEEIILKVSKLEEYKNKCEFKIDTYPPECYCKRSDFIFCNNAKLTEIPENLPSRVVGLFFLHNEIDLKSKDQLDFPRLKYLNLDFNNISHIPSQYFSNVSVLKKLYLAHNQIERLSKGCFAGLISLKWLFLENNKLTDFDLNELSPLQDIRWMNFSYNRLELKNSHYPTLPTLRELILDKNYIENINAKTFEKLNQLKLLSLNANNIKFIDSSSFQFLTQLKELRLSDNPIKNVADNTFENLPQLDALYLDNIMSQLNQQFFMHINVSYLSLHGLGINQIDFEGIASIENLQFVVYDKFYFCSETPKVLKCRPNTDGLSSVKDLLTKPSLRYSAWLMTLFTCLGNGLVLWGRFKSSDENRSVSLVIRNLAVADILMGLYLLIIGVQDFRFRNVYRQKAIRWMNSWECTIAGVLAMVSSEVSILILAFMSIERFLLIADPFGGHRRLNIQNVLMSLFIIWITGLALAVFPLILWRSTNKFYGEHSGTCFPLYIEERYGKGWQYSAFVFLGINLILMLLISILYSALMFSIWKTRRATTLNISDYEFAIRFFFIVLTDSACWLPIIALKILVFVNFEVSSDVYAWLVVFILPLNSAVNPLLYTFTTPKYRDQIFSNFYKGSTASRRRDGYGNSNQESQESNGKIVPLLNNQTENWRISI